MGSNKIFIHCYILSQHAKSEFVGCVCIHPSRMKLLVENPVYLSENLPSCILHRTNMRCKVPTPPIDQGIPFNAIESRHEPITQKNAPATPAIIATTQPDMKMKGRPKDPEIRGMPGNGSDQPKYPKRASLYFGSLTFLPPLFNLTFTTKSCLCLSSLIFWSPFL